jgi:acetoin utilization protein AcuB
MREHGPSVAHYMTHIPRTVERDASVGRAHSLMRELEIHHLPVTDQGKLVGEVSMRDLLVIEGLDGVDATRVPVEEAMIESPYTVLPEAPIDEVAAHMAAKRIGSAIVMGHEGNIEGIFTTTDALIALLHIWKRAP